MGCLIGGCLLDNPPCKGCRYWVAPRPLVFAVPKCACVTLARLAGHTAVQCFGALKNHLCPVDALQGKGGVKTFPHKEKFNGKADKKWTGLFSARC